MPDFFFKRLKLDQLKKNSGIFPENGRVFSTKTAYPALKKEKRPGVGSKREAGGGVLTPDAVCARLVQATAAVGAGVAGGGAQARHSHSAGFKPAFPNAPASRKFLKSLNKLGPNCASDPDSLIRDPDPGFS